MVFFIRFQNLIYQEQQFGLTLAAHGIKGVFHHLHTPSSGPPHEACPGLSCYLVASVIVWLMDRLATLDNTRSGRSD